MKRLAHSPPEFRGNPPAAGFAPTRPRASRLLLWLAVSLAHASLLAPSAQAETASSTPLEDRRGFRFDYEIAPILARKGCAAADCHGGATGRAHFKLSLFATDARADHRAIAEDLDSRRVDFANPEHSLLLRKPTRQLKHRGGKVLSREETSFHRLRSWIAAGAPFRTGDPHHLEALSLEAVETGRPRVFAQFLYEDGAREQRDVTAFALFGSTNPRTATVSEEGVIEWHQPGIAWITASYAGLSQRSRLIRPFSPGTPDSEPASAASDPGLPPDPGHPLDHAWIEALGELGLAPAGPASPRILARRLYLDLAGRVPGPDEMRSFLSLPEGSRVAATVENLLDRNDFNEAVAPRLWAWFNLPPPAMDDGPRAAAQERLRNRLRAWAAGRARFEDLADLVLDPTDGGFLQRFEDPRDRAEYFGETLLGLSIGCARCHNHPLDRWRQDEHLRFSAWFADPRPDPADPSGHLPGRFFLPGEDQAVPPALLPIGTLAPHGDDANESPAGPARAVLSQFLLGQGRDAFERNVANRVFGWLAGRPLVEPADDHRLTNPALHEGLLRTLLQTGHRDLRGLVRFVVTSRLYQTSSAPGPGGEISRARDPALSYLARRDAVALTETQRRRSIQHALGIPLAPWPEPADSPLALQLARLNDGHLQAALAAPGNAIDSLTLFEPDAPRRLDALFELILSRPPTTEEEAAFTEACNDAEGCRDLAFALFSGREFGSKR